MHSVGDLPRVIAATLCPDVVKHKFLSSHLFVLSPTGSNHASFIVSVVDSEGDMFQEKKTDQAKTPCSPPPPLGRHWLTRSRSCHKSVGHVLSRRLRLSCWFWIQGGLCVLVGADPGLRKLAPIYRKKPNKMTKSVWIFRPVGVSSKKNTESLERWLVWVDFSLHDGRRKEQPW